MFVYLVRHAIAVAREGGTAAADEDRALTAAGIKRFKRCVRSLSGLGIGLDEIWSSPLRRARETAELLARLDRFEGPVRLVDALLPGRSVSESVDELSRREPQGDVALVGHEPELGRLAGLLLTGYEAGVLAFKKGGVACLEVLSSECGVRAQLHWMLAPAHLRRMRLDS